MTKTQSAEMAISVRTHGLWAVRIARPFVWLAGWFSPSVAYRIGNAALARLKVDYRINRGEWRRMPLPVARMEEERP